MVLSFFGPITRVPPTGPTVLGAAGRHLEGLPMVEQFHGGLGHRCKLSTNCKRKTKWRRCVASSIAVGPSAILIGSRTRPSDWAWNRRFGPVEDRRINHRLVIVTCII